MFHGRQVPVKHINSQKTGMEQLPWKVKETKTHGVKNVGGTRTSKTFTKERETKKETKDDKNVTYYLNIHLILKRFLLNYGKYKCC